MFDTSHLNTDLKGHTVRGGKATLVAQAMSFVLNIASVMILARLLTPADFGLVAMVTAITGMLAIFKDAGLSMATVQRDKITHEQVSTLFWVNVTITFTISLFIAALGPVIAWFYSDQQLQVITWSIAAIFGLGGLTVQHQALLRRQMRFGLLARIQIFSTALALSVAIVSALMGMGYWALIVQIAVSETVGLALTWAYCRWTPGLPQRGVGIGSMLKFGGYLTGFSFVNYFARNTDNILIGKYWGGESLGIYSKAYSLLILPLQQINGPIAAVAIPALSRLQNNPEEFRKFFRKILGVISFVTFPLIAWMIICRNEIILLFLGPQWEGAIPIFAILAISAFFQPIGNISGVLYISLGRTKRMFKWGLISSTLIVTAFLVGLPYGPIGVAWAYSAIIALIIYPLIRYATSGTCLGVIDFLSSIKYPLGATITSSLIGVSTNYYFGEFSSLLASLIITTVSMCLAYLYIMYKIYPMLLVEAKTVLLRK